MSDAYYTATRDAGLIGDGDPASVEISDAAITKLAYDASAEGNKPLEIMSMVRALHFRASRDFDGRENDIKTLINAGVAQFRAAQRREQMRITREIGEGRDSDTPPKIETITVPEALERFVYVNSSRSVVDLESPGRVFGLAEFSDCYIGSKLQYADSNGSIKTCSVPRAWHQDVNRRSVDAVTWAPGRDVVTRCPEGKVAINTWRTRSDKSPSDCWVEQSELFTKHICFLFGDDSERFLDWLAHIIQRPGELPSFGFIHIAKSHGLGRNWVAGVLARVLAGNVAASFDLVGMLNSGFNGRLSQCLLAIVDEICEGGTSEWRHSNAIRQIVTADRRHINPKYGRQHVEYNCCRWLLLSNHTGALPLDDKDRRFFVVASDGEPRDLNYYKKLYGAMESPSFIASVRQFLKVRDISAFNPGERPPMNNAKLALISASKSEADLMAEVVVGRWPVDIIYLQEFDALLDDGVHRQALSSRHRAHVFERVGVKRWGVNGQVRLPNGRRAIAYIVRDHTRWMRADAAQVRNEQLRANESDKQAAMFGEAPNPPERNTRPPLCHLSSIVSPLSTRAV